MSSNHNLSILSGIAGSLQGNCSSGQIQWGQGGTGIGYYPTYYQAPLINFDIQIQRVENGWVLHSKGKQYVVTKPEDIVKFLGEIDA